VSTQKPLPMAGHSLVHGATCRLCQPPCGQGYAQMTQCWTRERRIRAKRERAYAAWAPHHPGHRTINAGRWRDHHRARVGVSPSWIARAPSKPRCGAAWVISERQVNWQGWMGRACGEASPVSGRKMGAGTHADPLRASMWVGAHRLGRNNTRKGWLRDGEDRRRGFGGERTAGRCAAA